MAYISFQHKDTISNPIRRAIMATGSGGDFVHCEIVLDNLQKQICSAWYPEGVNIRPFAAKVNPNLWENFDLGYVDYDMLRFFALKKETKYTLPGLVFNMALDQNLKTDKTFCSQICFEALVLVFPRFMPKVLSNSLSPMDLYNIVKQLFNKQTTQYGFRS